MYKYYIVYPLTSSASNGASGNIILTSNGATTVSLATDLHSEFAPTFTVDAGSDINYTAGSTIAFDATVNGLSSGGGGLSYTCIWSCGSDWDNNGFADGSSYSGGCSGNGLSDNVYGTGSSEIVGMECNAITVTREVTSRFQLILN